jgi:hypothetical protein
MNSLSQCLQIDGYVLVIKEIQCPLISHNELMKFNIRLHKYSIKYTTSIAEYKAVIYSSLTGDRILIYDYTTNYNINIFLKSKATISFLSEYFDVSDFYRFLSKRIPLHIYHYLYTPNCIYNINVPCAMEVDPSTNTLIMYISKFTDDNMVVSDDPPQYNNNYCVKIMNIESSSLGGAFDIYYGENTNTCTRINYKILSYPYVDSVDKIYIDSVDILPIKLSDKDLFDKYKEIQLKLYNNYMHAAKFKNIFTLLKSKDIDILNCIAFNTKIAMIILPSLIPKIREFVELNIKIK